MDKRRDRLKDKKSLLILLHRFTAVIKGFPV
jgi:hypothetical protein